MAPRAAPLPPEREPEFLSALGCRGGGEGTEPAAIGSQKVDDAPVFGHRLPTAGSGFVSRWLVASGGTTAGTIARYTRNYQ